MSLSNNLNITKFNDPVPTACVDNFLDIDFAKSMYNETRTVDDTHWSEFTRNKSYMKECKDLTVLPIASKFVEYMHSPKMLLWLEELTGISSLIPDPYLTGAGYSKSFKNDSLKVHTDFNWNEKLKLHRALSFIVYLTPEWNPDWGGALGFYDFKNNNLVNAIDCVFNRAVIWQYHKLGFHGYKEPLTCPEDLQRTTFRLFYYTSDSQYKTDDMPHRSLYWVDPVTTQPYDKRDQK